MDKRPFFSIVIPCYKAEEFFETTTKSVLTQSFGDVELILVDDYSPGKIPKMCDDLAAADDRVRVVHRETNGNISAATNDGLAIAQGEYISFLDSDDYYEPDVFQKIHDRITEEKEKVPVDIVQCTLCRERDGIIRSYPFQVPESFDSGENHIDTVLHMRTIGLLPSSNASKFIRTDLVKAHGFKFDSRYDSFQDLDFALRVYMAARNIIYLNIVTYVHVWQDGSVARSLSTASQCNRLAMWRDWLIYAETLPITEETRTRFINSTLGGMLIVWDQTANKKTRRPDLDPETVYGAIPHVRRYIRKWDVHTPRSVLGKYLYLILGPKWASRLKYSLGLNIR